MNEWIDVSQPLNDAVATWPGDTPFSYSINWSKKDSESVNVGKINMSVHTGTHIDSPFHFEDQGKKIIDLNINVFIGKSRVVYIPNQKSLSIEEFSHLDLKGVTRLLIRTDSWTNKDDFPDSIPHIEESVIDYLGQLGICLIGIDLPSIDPLDSKTLPAHHKCAEYGIYILEGMLLEKIEPGDYDLIALPLYLSDADGSPTRDVLKKHSR